MQVFRTLAGYSLGRADIVRRAMAKKKHDVLSRERENFILGAVFVGVAGLVYKKSKSRKSAFLGTVLGAIIMAVISIPSNYYIVYPAFSVIYGLPMEVIIGMYKTLLPSADNLFKALIIFNLPFNFAKGMIDAAICFLVYKRLSPLLKIKK